MIELNEQQIIDQVARRLADVHKQVEPAQVTRVVQEEYARFKGRPIRDFSAVRGAERQERAFQARCLTTASGNR
jgi:hypothetical protein